jgi:hypothetical protein
MLTPHRSPMANRGLRVYTCKFCVHRRSMTLGSQDGREDRAYEVETSNALARSTVESNASVLLLLDAKAENMSH